MYILPKLAHQQPPACQVQSASKSCCNHVREKGSHVGMIQSDINQLTPELTHGSKSGLRHLTEMMVLLTQPSHVTRLFLKILKVFSGLIIQVGSDDAQEL